MPSCSLGFESVKTVIMKSFKSHFRIWNLIMSWKHTQNRLVQFPKGRLVFWNTSSIVCSLSTSSTQRPPNTKTTISVLQSCSLLGFLVLLSHAAACSGHPPLPLRLPNYFYEELPLGGEAQDVAVEGWAQGQGAVLLQGFLSMSFTVLMASPV